MTKKQKTDYSVYGQLKKEFMLVHPLFDSSLSIFNLNKLLIDREARVMEDQMDRRGWCPACPPTFRFSGH